MAVRVIALVLLLIGGSGCDRFRRFIEEEPWKWSASGIAETRRRGDIISEAIEVYRAKTGKFPAALEELQPNFLREIPQPTVGAKQWEYELIDQGTNYSLQVVASEFGKQLSRASEGWLYIDEHGLRKI
jgi:hypothetical protein